MARETGPYFMFCLNPICLPEIGILPCGECRYCRMMRANLWAMRMMHELKYWDCGVFLTLTYNNENLPNPPYLDKKVLQDFLKRIRKAIEPRKIRYYAAGEYGETYGRPHYHLIIFGLSVKDYDLFRLKWGKGFVYVGVVNKKSCRYVSKYLSKAPLGRSRKEMKDAGKQPPFQTCSHYIGLRWIKENAAEVGERGLRYHGKQIGMPRYYVNKLRVFGVQNMVVEESRANAMSRLHEYYERLEDDGIRTEDEYKRRREEIRLMRIEEVKTKDGMYRGKDSQ